MNRSIFVTIAAILILGGLWIYSIQFPVSPEISNFESCVAAGYPVMESYPRQCRTRDGQNFIENIGNVLEKADFIEANIQPNQEIKSPLKITGKARGFWFFEADFPIGLFDSKGYKIATAIAKAEGEWMTKDFVPFSAVLNFETNEIRGDLVFRRNNPSDIKENDDFLIMPVKISSAAAREKKVKVYFSKEGINDCAEVFAVERAIPDSQAVGRLTIQELLKGPTFEEQLSEYLTHINKGVVLQKLTIENGVARADFNDKLDFQVGGSCRVQAIRAQIEETLEQFPSVDKVIISINGNSEDILQP